MILPKKPRQSINKSPYLFKISKKIILNKYKNVKKKLRLPITKVTQFLLLQNLS